MRASTDVGRFAVQSLLAFMPLACLDRATPAEEARPSPTKVAAPTTAPTASVAPAPSGSSAWARCEKDAECTFVALGCCSTTPVNRAHAAEARRALEASGRPFCPVKTACGPGGDGTWSGTPGKCSNGTCACDPGARLASNCMGSR